MREIEILISQIKNEVLTVKWDGWVFTGGRDWGDWTQYELYKNKEKYGSVEVNTRNGIEIMIGDELLVGDYNKEPLAATLEETLINAISRDDKEIAEKITIDGALCLPQDYGDISREDILTGRWTIGGIQ